MTKVAIVGSRNYEALSLVSLYVYFDIYEKDIVISGGAVGVDSMAASTAREKGIQVIEFYPDWKQYGKRAGYLRNELIVNACDRLVAFWDEESKGTMISVEIAKKQNKPVLLFGKDGKRLLEL